MAEAEAAAAPAPRPTELPGPIPLRPRRPAGRDVLPTAIARSVIRPQQCL